MFSLGIGNYKAEVIQPTNGGQPYTNASIAVIYPRPGLIERVKLQLAQGVKMPDGPCLYVGHVKRGTYNGRPYENFVITAARPLGLADAEKAWAAIRKAFEALGLEL